MKVALAQFVFESNTFVPKSEEVDNFKKGGAWLTSESEIRDWVAIADSQMGGSLKVLDEAGCETAPVFVALFGHCAGRLSAGCFHEIRTAIKEGLLRTMPADCIILHLHGAACAEGEDDTEGNLLEMVRKELGFQGRLVLSLDLHANITPRMVRHVDALTAYRTMPHRDFVQTGARAARLALAKQTFKCTVAKIAALIPPTDTNDLEGPFFDIVSQARQLEVVSDLADVSLFPVQPWLDVANLGSAIVITAKSEKKVGHQARDLAEKWYAQHHDWESHLMDWEAIKGKLQCKKNTPWILVDTADATTGGSPGNSAEALKQLLPLKDNLPGEVFLLVVDPLTVKAARKGASRFITGQPAVEWNAEVIFVGQGNYQARGKSYTGISYSMGEAAVLKSGKLFVVACTMPALNADPAFYESVGLYPDEALAVQVKSLKGWVAGYQAEESRGLHFDGPGYTSLNFAKYSFRKENRQLFPLHHEPRNPVIIWQ